MIKDTVIKKEGNRMIEIVKENGNVVDKREIPANLRPVGDPKGNEKIYIEDYIETFIKQIAVKDDSPKVLILYGENRQEDEMIHHYVCGAILAEEILTDEKMIFRDSIWKDVNWKAEHFFPNLQVVGWAYIRYDLADFAQGKVQYTHNRCFRKDQNVYLEYSAVEKKEEVFLVKNEVMEKQSGHFIYYERNEQMQNYMVTMKQDEPEEIKPEVDLAAKKCRGIVRGKKEELKHKQTMGMLYGTSMAMLLVITIVGVTLLNNYNKMQDMEKVLSDISNQMSQSNRNDLEETNAISDSVLADKDALPQENLLAENTEGMEADEIVNKDADGIANENEDGDTNSSADTENGELALADTATDASAEAADKTKETNGTNDVSETNAEQTTVSDSANNSSQKSADETANSATEKVVLQTSDEEVLISNDDSVEITEQENADTTLADSQGSSDQTIQNKTYRIEKGDTLSKISLKFYGDEYHIDEICRLNQISDKNEIRYGVNIVLP